MTDTSPQQVLERLLASADARDADVVRACLHPEVDFSAPGVSGDADSLLAWMSPVMAAASHLHHQVVSAVSAGDNAAAELAITVSFDPTDGPGSHLLRACNVWRCCGPDPTRPATTWPGRPAARPTTTSGPANGTACGPGRARPRPVGGCCAGCSPATPRTAGLLVAPVRRPASASTRCCPIPGPGPRSRCSPRADHKPTIDPARTAPTGTPPPFSTPAGGWTSAGPASTSTVSAPKSVSVLLALGPPEVAAAARAAHRASVGQALEFLEAAAGHEQLRQNATAGRAACNTGV